MAGCSISLQTRLQWLLLVVWCARWQLCGWEQQLCLMSKDARGGQTPKPLLWQQNEPQTVCNQWSSKAPCLDTMWGSWPVLLLTARPAGPVTAPQMAQLSLSVPQEVNTISPANEGSCRQPDNTGSASERRAAVGACTWHPSAP